MNKITVSNIKSGNPGVSGWDAILPQKGVARVLRGEVSADYCVIGAGFAGLAAARRLTQNQPNAKVVVVEAIRIGEGAAGRSSGFMIDLPHDISAESYTGSFDADKAQTAMNREALTFAAQAADDYDFSQEIFDPRGKVNASASDFGDEHNVEYAEYLHAMGEPCTPLTREQMREITGTDYYTSGLHTPGAVMIQPAGFVRAWADGLKDSAEIYENSPVTAMQREGATWHVETPNGKVKTPKVILAVNGHINSFGFYKKRLMHIFLYASLTRALTDAEIARLGGRERWEMVPADPMGSTMRKISGTGGQRILTRNKFVYSPSVMASEASVRRAARDHDKAFAARFPMLEGVAQEYRWGGRLCLSWNSVPVFGEVADGVYAAVCQNGLGASKGILSGMLSADFATNRHNPHINTYLNADKPTRLPPEPFSKIGATIYLNWKENRAGKEK